MQVLGVDEHVWRHTRRGDKYVTVIIDLTPIRDGTGPARLLDMVEGRSKQAFKTWLADRPQAWRDSVEVVAMDGFTGFKTATTEELPDAVAVMDPFHVVRLAGDALDRLPPPGPAGPARPPRPQGRPALHAPAAPCTPAPTCSPTSSATARAPCSPTDAHVEVEATWGIYQRMIAAYREPDRAKGREQMSKLIESRQHRRPARTHRGHHPGQDPDKRAADVLAYFDRPGTSNGPTEAINGRLEHLRGSALGFRNLTNYIARSCSRPADSDPDSTPWIRMSPFTHERGWFLGGDHREPLA